MNSHEYAEKLRGEADYLLTKDPFKIPDYMSGPTSFWYMWDKEPFLGAVRAVGSGRKEMQVDYVLFHPTDAPIFLKIDRNKVCKLVVPAQYDCEPFLSEVDMQTLQEAPIVQTEETQNAAS